MSVDAVQSGSMTGMTPMDDKPGTDFTDVDSAKESFVNDFLQNFQPFGEDIQYTDFNDQLAAHLGVDPSELQEALKLDGSESPTEVANRLFDALNQFNNDQGLLGSQYPDLNSLDSLDDPRAFTTWAENNYTPDTIEDGGPVPANEVDSPPEDSNLKRQADILLNISDIETPEQALERIDILSDEVDNIDQTIDQIDEEISDIETQMDDLSDQIDEAEANEDTALADKLEKDYDQLSTQLDGLQKDKSTQESLRADKLTEGSTVLSKLLSGDYTDTDGTLDVESLDLASVPPEFWATLVEENYSTTQSHHNFLTKQIASIDDKIEALTDKINEASGDDKIALTEELNELEADKAVLQARLDKVDFIIEQLEELIPEEFLKTESGSGMDIFQKFLGGDGEGNSPLELLAGMIMYFLNFINGNDQDIPTGSDS